MDDDRRKALEAAARAADAVADEHLPTCDAAVLMRAIGSSARAALAATGRGPAQVATPAYRDNWDTLFGKGQVVGQA